MNTSDTATSTLFALDRLTLRNRHRLSHQQIDRLLQENKSPEFRLEKMEQMNFVNNFLKVTALLQEEGISFITIKGPLLSLRIYGDPSVRFSHDVDILIELNDIERVVDLLEGNNYELTKECFWPKETVRQNLLLKSMHHLRFLHKQQPFCVEIHWSITQTLPLSPMEVKNLLRSNMTTMELAGRSFQVMNKEFELFFLMLHGSRHAWQRLKWLTDIYDYPLEDLDKDKFMHLIHTFHAERILSQTNYFLSEYLGSTLPFAPKGKLPRFFIRYAQESIDSRISTNQTIRSMVRNFIYLYFMFPCLTYKIEWLKSLFSRPGDVEVKHYSSSFRYYLYRVYGFVKRRLLHA